MSESRLPSTFTAPLAEVDPEVQNIIDKETWRQFSGLELIASEVCWFFKTRHNHQNLMRALELDKQGYHGGQWLHPDQQVL